MRSSLSVFIHFPDALPRARAGVLALTAFGGMLSSAGAVPDRTSLDQTFSAQVRPLLQKYCFECHNPEADKGDVDLESLKNVADYGEQGAVLDGVITVVEDHEMPPRKAMNQPTDAEREQIVEWMRHALNAAREGNPNDPARVVMPRLNHREYNFVIRDLTGLPIDAAQTFPRDGGGGEGFQNVGETHSMSPMQVEKYLKAARWIVDHAQILPDGTLLWYGTPLLPTPKRKQFDLLAERWDALHKVIAQRAYGKRDALIKQTGQGSPLVQYFLAAWRYQHRAALGRPGATVADIAAEGAGVLNPVTLGRWHALLTTNQPQSRYVQQLINEWRNLPAPGPGGKADGVKERVQRMDEWASNRFQIDPTGFFKQRTPAYEVVAAKGDRAAEKAFGEALQKQGRYSARLDFSKLPKDARSLYVGVSEGDDGPQGDVVRFTKLTLVGKDGKETPLDPNSPGLKLEAGRPIAWAADGLKVQAPFLFSFQPPADAKELIVAAELDRAEGQEGTVQMIVTHERPADLTFVGRRSLMAIQGNPKAEAFRRNKGELLECAHNNFLYSPGNIYAEYPGLDPAWFPRRGSAQSDPAEDLRKPFRLPLSALRAEATPAEAAELANLARGLAASRTAPAPAAFGDETVRRVTSAFASRAWRRPLAPEEQADLEKLYRASLANGANSEAALRQTLAAVLVSPNFLYRVQLSRGSEQPYELTDFELASRLSFFLWASKPDEELLRVAASGQLRRPEVLKAQARRLARDPRALALATEFAANWLHFEGFDTFTAPDTTRFPEFKPSLRKAMYDEAILFFDDLFRNDGPVMNVLNADYTFLNQELAEHYGIGGVLGPQMRKVAVRDGVRGGVLGMGSILTRTSKPLRTSPVLRGDWVLVNLLGTPTPPPPDDVPLLSDDEKNKEGLSLAEQLAVHRDNPSCRSCHEKLDPLGFTLENFDPIGRWRTKLATGDPVDNQGKMADGRTLDGVEGLRTYLREREDLILENFCRKLAGYALGRAIRVTDLPLLEAMKTALKANGTRFGAALDVIVTSQQFRTRRDVPVPTTTARNHDDQPVPAVAQNTR